VGITYGIRHLLYIEVEAHGDQIRAGLYGPYMALELSCLPWLTS
jgi:hypothetical protein